MSNAPVEADAVTVDIAPSSFSVTREKIAKILGYGETALPEHFAELIDAIVRKLPEKCSISAGYRMVTISDEMQRKDGLMAEEVFYTMQPIITSQLRKADKAALFVCTISSEMEEWAAQLFSNGDAVNGHFVDTIASAAVENAADLLHTYIEAKVREEGMGVTNRYSPGYCGWPVNEQQYLFGALPKGFCGISLTDTSLMVPKKSVSGIIGIGKNVMKEAYFCDRCGNTTCTYRAFLAAKNTRSKKND